MLESILLKKPYRPAHKDNRMRDEGDVAKARKSYFSKPSNNLNFLLAGRYSWMNDYIKETDSGLEIGAGTGISKIFIKNKYFLLTDFCENEWLDVKNVDALATPFNNESFDFIISSNMVHHVPFPKKFFKEMSRILRPGGVLLIQDINASFFMRVILRLMRHEGYSYDLDVFDEECICTDKKDLWSANCAISDILFKDKNKFERELPFFKIEKHEFSEFFIFLNSGGVIAKTFFVPLPVWALKFTKILDDVLSGIFPEILALQRRVVLRKTAKN